MSEKEMKLLEEQMRGWRPRRPSAGLKWRIWGAGLLNLPRMIRLAGLATPVTACALMALLVAGSAGSISTGAPAFRFTPAMMSNQDYAVYATSRQSVQNNSCAFNFDWTNDGNLNSNISSFLPGN